MKETAVEYLSENIDNLIPFMNNDIAKKFSELVEQAKEMEKQQIITAYNKAVPFKFGKEYYKETFENKL